MSRRLLPTSMPPLSPKRPSLKELTEITGNVVKREQPTRLQADEQSNPQYGLQAQVLMASNGSEQSQCQRGGLCYMYTSRICE